MQLEPSSSGGSVDGVDGLLAGLQSMPAADLADEALAEWLHFFAGHKAPSVGQNEGAAGAD